MHNYFRFTLPIYNYLNSVLHPLGTITLNFLAKIDIYISKDAVCNIQDIFNLSNILIQQQNAQREFKYSPGHPVAVLYARCGVSLAKWSISPQCSDSSIIPSFLSRFVHFYHQRRDGTLRRQSFTSAMASNPPSRYPPSNEELRRFYIGKDIGDVPKPAVVLDVAIIKRHCQALLQTMKQLGVGFRAHIKTHKVRAVTGFQTAN
jgi:hypothetical protein